MRAALLATAAAIVLSAGPVEAGSMSLLGVGPPLVNIVPPPAYTGEGDIQAYVAWAGLRAYSSAARGTNAIQICTPLDAACENEISDASTGNVDFGTVGATCNNSTTICTIKEFFDQTGNGHNWTQTTIANRAVLTLNCLNTSLPCATLNGSSHYPGTGNITIAQPVTVAWVGNRTGGFTSQQNVFEDAANLVQVGWLNSANTAYGYFGSVGSQAATDSAWHVIQIVAHNTGGTSSITVDATNGAHGVGGNGWSSNVVDFSGQDTGRQIVGTMAEFGVIAADGTANLTATCHNAFAYWATGTSC